ncbi:unnamed protein product, partial [Mesorhabditis spiculigera]
MAKKRKLQQLAQAEPAAVVKATSKKGKKNSEPSTSKEVAVEIPRKKKKLPEAAPPAEEAESEEPSEPEEEVSDEDEDESDEELFAEQTGEFEAFPMEEDDRDGIVNMLTQIFLHADLDLRKVAEAIIAQSPFGSVIGPAESSADDETANVVYGILTALPFTTEATAEIQKFILTRAKKNASKHILEKFEEALQKPCHWLINERMLNFPKEIAAPSFAAFQEDVSKMKDQPTNFIYIQKLRVADSTAPKPVVSNRKMGKAEKKRLAAAALESAEIEYDCFEDDLLLKLQQGNAYFYEYNVQGEIEAGSKFANQHLLDERRYIGHTHPARGQKELEAHPFLGGFHTSYKRQHLSHLENIRSGAQKTPKRRPNREMKKRSPQLGNANDAPLPPPTLKYHQDGAPRNPDSNFHGRRTYSEVVVEHFDSAQLHELSPPESSTRSQSEPVADPESLSYYSGNPFIEKTEGILHFYKYNDEALARESQSRMLCMLGVPSQVTARELISFIRPSIESIENMKIVRDSTPNQYMVIIKFKSHHDCVIFYEEYNGQEFNWVDAHRCTLLFVNRIETADDESDRVEMTKMAELPTCAVCLERMDDGVLSILCNHTFHATCLQKWTDTTCPVCRHTQTPELVADQRCTDCGSSSDLWICLICGNIGCGRYADAHAYRHFESTSHTFCLQVGGERVWDYVGDNYVHRLIHSSDSGKIVEYQRGGMSEGEKDGKLDSLNIEYTVLLTSQLDAQREHYEAKLTEEQRKGSNFEKMALAQMDDLEEQLKRAVSECNNLREQLSQGQASKTALEKKCQAAQTRLNKAVSELEEERSLNAAHRADHHKWVEKVVVLEKEKQKQSEEMAELRSQINDLMMHFEAQTRIQEQLDGNKVTSEEVEEAQLGVAQSPAKGAQRKKRSGRK